VPSRLSQRHPRPHSPHQVPSRRQVRLPFIGSNRHPPTSPLQSIIVSAPRDPERQLIDDYLPLGLSKTSIGKGGDRGRQGVQADRHIVNSPGIAIRGACMTPREALPKPRPQPGLVCSLPPRSRPPPPPAVPSPPLSSLPFTLATTRRRHLSGLFC
jgi:hypothetical protein